MPHRPPSPRRQTGRTPPRRRPPTPEIQVLTDTTAPRAVALAAADAAADKKATDIRILELGDLLGITDFFVLASARNERQLSTIVESVQEALQKGLGRKPRRREGARDTGWMLLDYGDVVVHAFTEEQRGFYDLERLWSDAPVVPYEQPEDAGISAEPEPAGDEAAEPWYAAGDG